MSRGALLTSLIAILLLIPACGSGASESSPQASGSSSVASPAHADGDRHDTGTSSLPATGDLQVTLVASQLVVGPNRFAVGLFGPDGTLIEAGAVQLRYFDLTDPETPTPESQAVAERLQSPDGLTTIFAHEREFDRAGAWGVEVQVQLPEGTTLSKAIRFEVAAEGAAILPGETAPHSDSPTSADVDNDLSRLTSASQPNPAFYQQSIAEAVSSGRPTLILFATPAFCQTRFCGPGYEIVSAIHQRYESALNVVHVEVYQGLPDPAASRWSLAPAMDDFGLATEPWLYLVDAAGTVVYRVEALFTQAEIERQLDRLGLPTARE